MWYSFQGSKGIGGTMEGYTGKLEKIRKMGSYHQCEQWSFNTIELHRYQKRGTKAWAFCHSTNHLTLIAVREWHFRIIIYSSLALLFKKKNLAGIHLLSFCHLWLACRTVDVWMNLYIFFTLGNHNWKRKICCWRGIVSTIYIG